MLYLWLTAQTSCVRLKKLTIQLVRLDTGFIGRNWIDENGLCDLLAEHCLLSPMENDISHRNWIWHDGIIRLLLVIYVFEWKQRCFYWWKIFSDHEKHSVMKSTVGNGRRKGTLTSLGQPRWHSCLCKPDQFTSRENVRKISWKFFTVRNGRSARTIRSK